MSLVGQNCDQCFECGLSQTGSTPGWERAIDAVNDSLQNCPRSGTNPLGWVVAAPDFVPLASRSDHPRNDNSSPASNWTSNHPQTAI